jgi:ATP-dependent Lhr-like helicase
MQDGEIEALHVPRNPLDVLRQQIVAMVATDDWAVAELARSCAAPRPSPSCPTRR